MQVLPMVSSHATYTELADEEAAKKAFAAHVEYLLQKAKDKEKRRKEREGKEGKEGKERKEKRHKSKHSRGDRSDGSGGSDDDVRLCFVCVCVITVRLTGGVRASRGVGGVHGRCMGAG
jgi:hypothetical protein